ncbi:hypothetical protein V6Z12_D11G304400 [Gossypium hirsutum]
MWVCFSQFVTNPSQTPLISFSPLSLFNLVLSPFHFPLVFLQLQGHFRLECFPTCDCSAAKADVTR